MAARADAGASVSSGASYQARVGAYLLTTIICDAESEITGGQKIVAVGFETTESVDDINIAVLDGDNIYIQAKFKIDFSVSDGSELWSVIRQFERQNRAHANRNDRYYLITTSQSSRKVIYDMRAALEAFRLGEESAFRRDQPRALVRIIDDLINAIKRLQAASGQTVDEGVARAVLQKTFVFVMDLDSGDVLEHGLLLLLQSPNFAAPAALWGKITADCVSHAKSRHTVNATVATTSYERFRVKAGQVPESASEELLRIELGTLNFAVGREVLLGHLPLLAEDASPGPIVILEIYRFDDNCGERAECKGGVCNLSSGMQLIPLIRRAATYEGLKRLIAADPSLIGNEPVPVLAINSDENFEVGLCAETHRERLKQAALANPHLLRCIPCEKPVSSNDSPLIEAGYGEDLIVGLSHAACLAPDDRILGTIQSRLFEEHSALINFDYNAWFRASDNGQIAFRSAEFYRLDRPILAWGGRKVRAPAGPFVVEVLLQGGGSEFLTNRNSIDRLSHTDAEKAVALFREAITRQAESDPFCCTEQSKMYGPRSTLIQQFGGSERFVVVKDVRIRNYDQRFAARYTRPGNLYAPLLYLRDTLTHDVLSILNSVVLLTDHFSIRNYLDNWREAGVSIPNYEAVSLLTDREFDDFMLWLEDNEQEAIADPMLGPDYGSGFVSGVPIVSVERIMAAAHARNA